MGAFDAPKDRKDVITIRADWWEQHESCEARTIVRSGDEEWVLNQQMLIQPKRGNRKQRRAGGFQREQDADIEFKNQLGATRRLWIQKMLEGWTFTMGGQPMPFVKSGNNEIDDKRMGQVMTLIAQDYIDFIYEAIMEAQPKQAQPQVNEEEESDEEGSPFTANALTSTAGAIAWPDLNPLQGEKSSRNFLAKS